MISAEGNSFILYKRGMIVLRAEAIESCRSVSLQDFVHDMLNAIQSQQYQVIPTLRGTYRLDIQGKDIRAYSGGFDSKDEAEERKQQISVLLENEIRNIQCCHTMLGQN